MGAPRNAVTPVRVVPANSISHREVPDSVPAYSTTKFLALQAYCRTNSSWRMLWTCLTLPLPALLFAVIPAMLPLKHPREGVTVWYTLHASCITTCAILEAAMHYTSATGLAQAGFFRKILVVAIIGAILSITDLTIMQVYWKVPVPFGLIILTTMGFVDIGIALVLVLGRSLWELPIFLRSVKVYAPSMSIQTTQIIIYPAFSVLYDKANNT